MSYTGAHLHHRNAVADGVVDHGHQHVAPVGHLVDDVKLPERLLVVHVLRVDLGDERIELSRPPAFSASRLLHMVLKVNLAERDLLEADCTQDSLRAVEDNL